MKLVVGIGNPESRYLLTRHNAGFLVVDLLSTRWGIPLSHQKFQGVYGRGDHAQDSVLLLKPMTYMNRSGMSVAAAAHFFKIPPEDIIVLHDDVDVPQGKIKIRMSGGHGGHNGIRNIIEELGNDRFARIKLGIGRPPAQWETQDWVLGVMSEAELEMIHTMATEVEQRLAELWRKI